MIKTIYPQEAETGCDQIVDVREFPEYAAAAIPGARLVPLGSVEQAAAGWDKEKEVVLVCRTGKRATQAAKILERLEFKDISVLEGGMEGWRQAGLPTQSLKRAPWSLERQVRAIAGSMVVISIALAFAVSAWFFAWTLLVGVGLIFAGVTDFCLMASVLGKLPWNRAKNSTTQRSSRSAR